MTTDAATVTGRRSRMADFIALTKPRLNSLVVVTTGVGYFAAQPETVDPVKFINTIIGAALVAGGASALNQITERKLDERMLRTRNRPLPGQRLQPAEAAWFAVFLVIAGLLQIVTGANLNSAIIAFCTLVSYVWIYTPLKQRTHWAMLVGAVPGGLPVVIGWAAARPLTASAWSLFALVFVWQLPHFLALTWLYRDDFKKAGLPLLAVTDPSGRRGARHLLVYTVLLIPASLAPAWLNIAGSSYVVGTGLLGIGLLAVASWFARHRSTDRARLLFKATLLYLPLIWVLLLMDGA